jgi:hypothetical protein
MIVYIIYNKKNNIEKYYTIPKSIIYNSNINIIFIYI